ncbi:MAG: MFS transporter [FCB group bacterium]|jgi:MFS family permease
MNLTTMNAQGEAKAIFRWMVLIFVSVVIGTNYYVYDAMSSIKSVMQSQLGFSSTDYGLIVSFYSVPNTFLLMAIFGGIILDKWGIRKTGFLFLTFCVLGTFLTAYGASGYFQHGGFGHGFFSLFLTKFSPELKIMMLGRLLFGLGAETSIVVISKIIVKWFKGKELAFAFAINLAIARLGTAAALIFSPVFIDPASIATYLNSMSGITKTIFSPFVGLLGSLSQGSYNLFGWTSAIWIAAVLMGVGLVFFVIYMFFDKSYERINEQGRLLAPDEEFHLKDIWDLLKNKAFIYISLLCVTFYSAVFPFQAYCPDLLHNKFGVSIGMSGTLTSLIIWGTIVFTPLFGGFVDRKGKRASLMFIGSFLLIFVHLILSLTYFTPYIAMFILGIAFSLVPAAMWPAVALIVEEKKLGTAYGLMTSIQNLGLSAFPFLAGVILDKTNTGISQQMLDTGKATLNYTYTILMFAGLGIIGFLFAYLLKREDGKSGNRLEFK